MREGSPEQGREQSPREIAEDALVGINSARDIINDMDALPLSVDTVYQDLEEQLQKRANYYGKALFEQARNTQGDERLKYVRGLDHLMMIVGKEISQKLLQELMTTPEAIIELHEKAEKELPPRAKIREKTSVYRDLLSMIFRRWK